MKSPLCANVYGKGPVILMLHGLFGSRDNLRSLGKMLSTQYQVHLPDLRNHGSSFHASSMTYPEMANDVLCYLSENRIEKACIIGHSMGGKVAMQMGLMAPDRISSLIILDIAPINYNLYNLSDRHGAIIEGLRKLATMKLNNRAEADTFMRSYVNDAATRAFLLKNLERNANGTMGLKLDIESIYKNHHNILDAPIGSPFLKPTLFIKGQRSDYMLEKYRPQTLKFFPNATLEVIKDTGHWLHAEKKEAVYESMVNFLAKINKHC